MHNQITQYEVDQMIAACLKRLRAGMILLAKKRAVELHAYCMKMGIDEAPAYELYHMISEK